MSALFQFDSLALTSMVLYAALAVVTLAMSPKRERTATRLAAIGLITFGTLLAYASASLAIFALGWTISVVPVFMGWRERSSRLALGVGTLAVIAGAVMAGTANMGSQANQNIVFALLALAMLLRKGLLPFYWWVPNAFGGGLLGEVNLLLNGHLSAYLLVRFLIPQLPEAAHLALPYLSGLALLTALLTALTALGERQPRRILALISLSQASFILAGLQDRNEEGITGALVQWFVVAAATTGLVGAYRALEARYPSIHQPLKGYLGLATATPRLAVLFAICGFALIGLPGTLGFAAEDLLFHGSLEAHPLLGVTLPLATALNGIAIYRLFSHLFLGRTARAVAPVADLLPRERWALSATVIFLVAGGIAPSMLIALRRPAAEYLAGILMGK